MYNNQNKTINLNHLKDLQLIKDDMINNSLIADSCKHFQLYALEQMFIPNSVTLYSKLKNKHFVSNELVCVLFQVYALLRIYQNMFTHYDLNIKNVLLIEIPNKTLHFTYTESIPKREISFTSRYLVKIIDYGRSYCQKATETFRALLCNQTKECENCGKFDGYYALSNDEKPGDLKYLKTSFVNRSTDLRLLDVMKVLIKKQNPELSNLLQNVHYLKDSVFSPEIRESGFNKNKIYNVEDAYQLLFRAVEQKKHISSKPQIPVYGNFIIDTNVVKSIDEMKSHSPYTFTLG